MAEAFARISAASASAIAVVLILASGIAATRRYSRIVDAVLLKPLPYPDPDRLVTVMEASFSRPQPGNLIAPPRLEDWNRMNRTFRCRVSRCRTDGAPSLELSR